jgi:hypothetical protein
LPICWFKQTGSALEDVIDEKQWGNTTQYETCLVEVCSLLVKNMKLFLLQMFVHNIGKWQKLIGLAICRPHQLLCVEKPRPQLAKRHIYPVSGFESVLYHSGKVQELTDLTICSLFPLPSVEKLHLKLQTHQESNCFSFVSAILANDKIQLISTA